MKKDPSLRRCRWLLRGAVVALAAACNAPGGRQAAWGAAVPKGSSRHNPDIYDICQLWGRCSCCSCSACSVAPGAGCPSRGGQREEEDASGMPSIRREILQDVWGCDGKGGECAARCRETAPESLLALRRPRTCTTAFPREERAKSPCGRCHPLLPFPGSIPVCPPLLQLQTAP